MRLIRLLDDELHLLGPRTSPIRLPWRWPEPEKFELSKTLAGATALFGRSSEHFDDYKQTFRFPFMLTGQRGKVSIRYLVNVMDLRGDVEVSFHRYHGKISSRGEVAPVRTEMTADELIYLGDFILGYLLGAGSAQPGSNFFHAVSADLLVYGMRAGVPFQQEYPSSTKFERALKALEKEFKDPDIERANAVLKELDAWQPDEPVLRSANEELWLH